MPKPTEDYVLEYVKNCKQEAKDASKALRRLWTELWQTYQNHQDYSAKEKWQSKCCLPKIFMTVERATSLVSKALFDVGRLFKMEIPASVRAKAEGNDEILDEMEVKRKKDEQDFKSAIEESNFSNIYSEMTKGSFLLGSGDVKVLWENGLHYENVDIQNTFWHPKMKPLQQNPKYMIEYKEMDLATLHKIAKKVNKDAHKQVYKMSKIKEIASDAIKQETKRQADVRKGLWEHKLTSPQVSIDEFWGDIVHENGTDITENQLISIANENTIIRWHNNPFDHKRAPTIKTSPIIYPHRGIAGVSLVEHIVRIWYVLNNVVNMGVDNMNYSINKMFEIQTGLLLDAATANRLFPGKTFKVRGQGQAVREVATYPISGDFFKMVEVLDREIQRGTAVTEFLEALGSTRKVTKGEVDTKTEEAHTFFDVIARRLELNSIKPVLQMSWELMKQFADKKGDYEFKVGGLSLLLLQKEQTEKLMQILGMAGKAPLLQQLTDIPELWKKLLTIYNLSEVYKEPEPMTAGPGEQGGDVDAQAAAAAEQEVSKMTPQEIMSS